MSTAITSRQTTSRPAPFIAATGNPSTSLRRPSHIGPIPRADNSSTSLERIGVPVVYVAGKVIFEAGDPVRNIFRVTHGVVRAVRLLADGRRCITNFFTIGDFIALAEDEEHAYTLEAVTDARLTSYPRSAFNAVLESDPAIGRRLLSVMCSELSATHDRLLLLGRKSAVERIATFLLGMADRAPETESDNDVVLLPMSRSDIADYLGLTIETVSRTFAQLLRRQIVALSKPNRVVVLDRDTLEDISTGDA